MTRQEHYQIIKGLHIKLGSLPQNDWEKLDKEWESFMEGYYEQAISESPFWAEQQRRLQIDSGELFYKVMEMEAAQLQGRLPDPININ